MEVYVVVLANLQQVSGHLTSNQTVTVAAEETVWLSDQASSAGSHSSEYLKRYVFFESSSHFQFPCIDSSEGDAPPYILSVKAGPAPTPFVSFVSTKAG